MKRIGHWSWVLGACALGVGMEAIAMSSDTRFAIAAAFAPVGENYFESDVRLQSGEPQQLAQGLRGQCRQAYQNIFIYRTRSTSEAVSSVVQDERVVLAEDSARNGWIAISSPTVGFVEARYLKLCDRAGSVFPSPPPIPPAPPSRVSRPARPTRPASNLCRRVTYAGPEGMTIRSGPSVDFPRVGGVFFDNRVTINPTATRLDSQGREWLRMTAPTNGWISNGFPAFGESNLGSCS
ncbi:MAG: SH3 domain-containing protein [Cyanobacteriota bacterium]|nr:SH3 domain-containing protein [Cyanobacteriota bacterium]